MGRRIVVTGASSGIGRALAVAYAAAGASVVAVGRDPERLSEVARTSTRITPVTADITSASGRDGVLASVSPPGSLDVVVHCAGGLGVADTELEQYPEAEWREVFEVNLTAVHLLHQALAPLLESGDSPAVIAVGSTVGRVPRAGWGAYAVSKGALESWVALLATEWRRGRVYSVNPGGTRTPMRAAARPDEDPAAVPAPEEVTPLFLRLAHPRAPEPTGSILDARPWIGRDPWDGLQLGS